METYDEGDQSLYQSIEGALSGVHIAVIDPVGDTTNSLADDRINNCPGPVVSEADIKVFLEQLKETGGDESAGQNWRQNNPTARHRDGNPSGTNR